MITFCFKGIRKHCNCNGLQETITFTQYFKITLNGILCDFQKIWARLLENDFF